MTEPKKRPEKIDCDEEVLNSYHMGRNLMHDEWTSYLDERLSVVNLDKILGESYFEWSCLKTEESLGVHQAQAIRKWVLNDE